MKPFPFCDRCKSPTEPHCDSPTCPWERCRRGKCGAYGYHETGRTVVPAPK